MVPKENLTSTRCMVRELQQRPPLSHKKAQYNPFNIHRIIAKRLFLGIFYWFSIQNKSRFIRAVCLIVNMATILTMILILLSHLVQNLLLSTESHKASA